MKLLQDVIVEGKDGVNIISAGTTISEGHYIDHFDAKSDPPEAYLAKAQDELRKRITHAFDGVLSHAAKSPAFVEAVSRFLADPAMKEFINDLAHDIYDDNEIDNHVNSSPGDLVHGGYEGSAVRDTAGHHV